MNEIIVNLVLSSVVSGVFHLAITKDILGLGVLKSSSHIAPFLLGLAQYQVNKLNDLPAGEYNVYAVTIAERYRLVDPGTGQFYGWRCVTTTRYYVNCGQWIEVTDRWD